jgi:PEGA domain
VLATSWLPRAEVAAVSGDTAADRPASPGLDDVAVVAAARTTANAGGATDGPAEPPVTSLRASLPAAAPGRLVIRSEPSGALVTIDGRRAGATPLVIRDLPLGSYRVAVAHPGHVPWTERVTLGSRAPARTLAVTLAPGLEAVAATRGAIDVDSRPRGARVVVDNRFVGHAPLRLVDVTPGEHLVRLELGGHVPAEGRVYVAGGRPAPIRLTLRPVVSSGGYGQ